MPEMKFDYLRYNSRGVLKVNLITIASILFFSRHLLGFFVVGMAFSRSRGGSSGAFEEFLAPTYILADIPALLLLFASFARHPKGGDLSRRIWRHGPYMFVASLAIYLYLLIDDFGFDLSVLKPFTLVSIGIMIAVIAYAFIAPYARELYAQFPDKEAED